MGPAGAVYVRGAAPGGGGCLHVALHHISTRQHQVIQLNQQSQQLLLMALSSMGTSLLASTSAMCWNSCDSKRTETSA